MSTQAERWYQSKQAITWRRSASISWHGKFSRNQGRISQEGERSNTDSSSFLVSSRSTEVPRVHARVKLSSRGKLRFHQTTTWSSACVSKLLSRKVRSLAKRCPAVTDCDDSSKWRQEKTHRGWEAERMTKWRRSRCKMRGDRRMHRYPNIND